MGFELDPALYTYTTPPSECPACYDPGDNPSSLFITLQGCQTGALWNPGDGEPPNGTHEVLYQDPPGCEWSVPALTTTYHASAAPSVCAVFQAFPQPAFIGTDPNPCASFFDNDNNAPAGNRFWGGTVSITSALSSTGVSAFDTAELIGIEPGPDVWCDPYPIDAANTVFRFTRYRDATNVLVKIST